MVLGAIGSNSTDADEKALIEKMYNLMKAGGMLANETTLEQAYPTLRNIIIADSARRQNLNAEADVDIPNAIGPLRLNGQYR